MSDPDQAGHALGKLLQRVGEDRVLWGTDGIWYGSPQPQIMAFRAFQISAEHQERYGYPALTDEVKRKVFGLNAARLFGVDPEATRCALDGVRARGGEGRGPLARRVGRAPAAVAAARPGHPPRGPPLGVDDACTRRSEGRFRYSRPARCSQVPETASAQRDRAGGRGRGG